MALLVSKEDQAFAVLNNNSTITQEEDQTSRGTPPQAAIKRRIRISTHGTR